MKWFIVLLIILTLLAVISTMQTLVYEQQRISPIHMGIDHGHEYAK